MEIATVNCTSCGAPIKIPPELEHFNCAYCGASLVVQRGEGYVALKLAEQVSKSIQDVGVQTQSTIRESTQVTQIELKRLQIGQEISSVQIQLSSIQSEIRALQRQKADRRIKKQLKELSGTEAALISRIQWLQMTLAQSYPVQTTAQTRSGEGQRVNQVGMNIQTSPKSNFCASPLSKGCLTSLLVMVLSVIMCGIPAEWLDQAIFKIPMNSSSSSVQASGPIFSVATIIIIIVGIVGFIYGVNPKAKIWVSAKNWIRERIGKGKKLESSPTASVPAQPEADVSEKANKSDQP